MLIISILLAQIVSSFNISQDSNIVRDTGYIAYYIEPEDRNYEYSFVTVSTVLSYFLPNYMGGGAGFLYGGVVGVAGWNYAVRNSWDEAQASFQQIWANTESDINKYISSKSLAKFKDELRTLNVNVHEILNSYMAELGASSPQEMVDMKTGFNVSAELVDGYMTSIDNLLSASTVFSRYTKINSIDPEYFVLGDSGKIGKKRCLHTEAEKIDDGTLLVLDEECDFTSLSDKLWSVDITNRLVLRTAVGDKCISYRTRSWHNSLKEPLAVYDLGSKQCAQGRALKLKQNPVSGYSLYDGSKMICAQPAKKPNSNYLVTREAGNKCINNNTLALQSKIPIPITNSRGVLVPAMNLDEIYIQMYYMPAIANLHLACLKEMYLHGTQTIFAASKFNSKVKEYSGYLTTNLPIFAEYATFRGYTPKQQILVALNFAEQLENATLALSPNTISFPRQVDQH